MLGTTSHNSSEANPTAAVPPAEHRTHLISGDEAPRAARRPSGMARRPSIPGVCKEGATQPDGMYRRPNADGAGALIKRADDCANPVVHVAGGHVDQSMTMKRRERMSSPNRMSDGTPEG